MSDGSVYVHGGFEIFTTQDDETGVWVAHVTSSSHHTEFCTGDSEVEVLLRMKAIINTYVKSQGF